MAEIPAKRFAGVMMILIPLLFWLFVYVRYDCQGGSCSIDMEWLVVGFFLIMFGLFVLLSGDEKTIPKLRKKEENEPRRQG